MDGRDDGFLSRWSQRKAKVREGQPVAEPPTPVVAAPQALAVPPPAIVAVPAPAVQQDDTSSPDVPPPTLEDVAQLTRDSDFSRFVAPHVDGGVRNAALHKLFSDPHFNIMDGLDTYIDDYSIPDPLPPGMLRRMIQSETLGLFKTEPAADNEPATTESQVPDEDLDLRLQPHDAAGSEGAEPGVGEDAASQP
jgi:Protein of unknown function (DUF3306)